MFMHMFNEPGDGNLCKVNAERGTRQTIHLSFINSQHNYNHFHMTAWLIWPSVLFYLSLMSILSLALSVCLSQIQRALLRNNQTQRFSQKQALRLHQGLVTSTAEQVQTSSSYSHVFTTDVTLLVEDDGDDEVSGSEFGSVLFQFCRFRIIGD